MRDINPLALTALANDAMIHIIPLADFDFVEGIERFWAGPEGHALSWNSQVWNSISDIGQIDKISEAQQGLADARTVVSLRVNSEQVDVIDGADSRGRAANIHLLIVSDTLSVLGSLSFAKTMGALRVLASVRGSNEEQDKIVEEKIELELLDETATLGRSFFTRMTYEQGLRIDPADHGLQFVSDPTMGNLPGGLTDARNPPQHYDNWAPLDPYTNNY
jgi:hypothetical protein